MCDREGFRRYSEVVLRRGTGVLLATHPNRHEQTLCRTTVTSTAGSSVVLDTTAIVVLNTLPAAVRDLAVGLFGGVMTTDPVLLDARLVDEMLSRRSTTEWRWNDNTEAGGPVETGQRNADRLAEESARLVVAVERLVRRPRPSLRVSREAFSDTDRARRRSKQSLGSTSQDLRTPICPYRVR